MEEKQEENLFSQEEWDELIEWHPVSKEVEEQKALEKPDFYNRILLKRSGR